MEFSPKPKRGSLHFFSRKFSFSPRLKIGLIAILLVVFFIVLNLTGLSKEIKNTFYLIFSPLQKVLWKAGDSVSDFLAVIAQMNNLKKENEGLRLKIYELLSENTKLKEFKKENETLKKALGIGLEKEFKFVMAEVISKDILEDSILIDKGSDDGIKENMPVITAQKVLSGKINEVFEKHSRVLLLTNKKSTFNASLQEKDINGVIKGKGALNISFEFIPRAKEILKGDIVITSQLGGVFPKGLLVGEIREVKKSDVEPFQQAEVKPFFDIKEIETFFVITNF